MLLLNGPLTNISFYNTTELILPYLSYNNDNEIVVNLL